MNLLIVLFSLLFSSLVAAAPLKNFVVFGDSLSDNGNLYNYMQQQVPQSPPYYEGRFSNGPVWVEQLVESYFPGEGNSRLLDYAFGGAGISMDDNEDDDGVLFTLKREIDAYLLAHEDKASQDSLFIVWIGANNYLVVPEDPEQTLARVNKGIVDGIELLVARGAKHIMVLNLPDLGKSPAAGEYNSREQLTELSQRHNEMLLASFEALKKKHKNVDWVYVNANSFLDQVIASPEQYGFNNVTDTCYDIVAEKRTRGSVIRMASAIKLKPEADSCEGYLFFDPVHPTAPAHKLVADVARQALDEAGEEFR
ncbi:GDSL family lysophospholipase PlaA [Legionella dresdenensis]|uniref:GDSL family lysophospholipase PlaA n=1 Tax=Legionella dresdenensis TaxID=450200 RepID=A0ABV8CHT7_9GAMM